MPEESSLEQTLLKPECIISTVEILSKRIDERFPGSGLASVCLNLLQQAKVAKNRATWIDTPHGILRGCTIFTIASLLIGAIWLLYQVKFSSTELTLEETLPLIEATMNVGFLMLGALYFLISLETRHKRKKALSSLHKLRSLSHVIDMHQLTKDSDRLTRKNLSTTSSPKINMTAYELSRYFDYCSEMLSLIGKVSALYAQTLEDEVVLSSVNNIETLTTGLSNKIWQKSMIVHNLLDKESA